MVWDSRRELASLQWGLLALCPLDVDPIYRPLHYACCSNPGMTFCRLVGGTALRQLWHNTHPSPLAWESRWSLKSSRRALLSASFSLRETLSWG